jgi:NADPH:quinone reductase-like Zn-dependent oxidoreductase
MATFQQFALVPAEIVAKIPAFMSFDQAATIPLALATAAVGLYLPLGEAFKMFHPDGNAGIALTAPWTPEGKDKYKGQSVVVLGGSSSVGQFAIQLLKLSGYSQIITTSSKVHEEFLKSLGATHVVDRHGDQAAAIKSLLPDGFTDVLYDAVSTEDSQRIALTISSPKASISLTRMREKDLDFGERFVVTTFGSVHVQRKLGVSLYGALAEMLEAGAIKVSALNIPCACVFTNNF